MTATTATKTVFVQNWEESERGWGVRPDGFTVHISKDQLFGYVAWYNKAFNNLSEAPDEYTRVSGAPIEVEVTEELFDKIKKEAQAKRDDGAPMNAARGKTNYFSPTPMRSLRDSDIAWR